MNSSRANRSNLPSPMFTYATTTVPRSLPMLSSSSTPFFPQSQQNYHSQLDASGNYDASCYGPHTIDFYSQQCYTSSQSDRYKAYLWGGGGAWESGIPLSEMYLDADDEFNDPAYPPSDPLSYYEEFPGMEQDFYAFTTNNAAFVAGHYPDPGATSFNVPQSGAQSQQISCFSKVKENLSPSLKNSFIQDQAVPYLAFEKGGPTKSMSSETAKAFSSSKPDAGPFSMKVSSKMCSSSGITNPTAEPNMKQAPTTDMTENRGAQTDGSKLFKKSCCSSGDEDESLESVELKHSIQATSNSANIFQSIKGSNLNAPTMSIATEVKQKEADNSDSMLPESSSCQLLSISGQCSGVILPKHIHAQPRNSSAIEDEQRNMGSLLSKPSSLITGMEGKTCVEALDHERKMGSSYILPGDARLHINRSQLMVECIHSLSKVLLSSQSGTSLNILDPNDCLALENAIFILSQRLYQSSINEGNLFQDQNYHKDAEQGLNIFDDKLKEEAGNELFQQEKSFLLEGMKLKPKTVSPSGILEDGALDGLSKLTSNFCVGDRRAEQSSFVKKELKKPLEDMLMLQCNCAKLKEEVAYERAESNATVTIYKKLWSEAEEALNVLRLEIEKLRAELAGLQRGITNLKHSEELGGLGTDLELTKHDMKTLCNNSGGLCEDSLDVKTTSRRDFTLQDIYSSRVTSKKSFPACSEVYSVPVSISSHTEGFSFFAKGKGTILSQNNQSGKRFEVSTTEPLVKRVGGTNLRDQVEQRLSVLRARQGLDLNKTDADIDVELPSSLSSSLEASSNLPRKGEALPPDKKGNCLIGSETSHMANVNKKIRGVKADLSCGMMPAFDANYGDCSLTQTQSNSRSREGMDFEDVNVSTCEEDEIEIICLKPGFAETSSMCLKEEPEWEHVVVTGLDSHKNKPIRRSIATTNSEPHL